MSENKTIPISRVAIFGYARVMQDTMSAMTATADRLNEIELSAKGIGLLALARDMRRWAARLRMQASAVDTMGADMRRYLEDSGFMLDDVVAHRVMALPVQELCLSLRPMNVFYMVGIRTVGNLVQFTAPELLRYRNFGPQSLREVELALNARGLRLGMPVPDEFKRLSPLEDD